MKLDGALRAGRLQSLEIISFFTQKLVQSSCALPAVPKRQGTQRKPGRHAGWLPTQVNRILVVPLLVAFADRPFSFSEKAQ
jgi:hypothetical protein